MNDQGNRLERDPPEFACEQSSDDRACVLLVTPDPCTCARIVALMDPTICVQARSGLEARDAIESQTFELIIIDDHLPDCGAVELCATIRSNDPTVTSVVLTDQPTLEEAVTAMRCGAADLLSPGASDDELVSRLVAALERGCALTKLDQRVRRLRTVCRRLNRIRRRVTSQMDTMCSELVGAYQDLSDQMAHVTLVSEFKSLVRQELDIENLLRTVLEFVLARTGPTNAAVFLPSTTDDFSLGAYVNYDCDKDTADVLLDQLANILAPRFESDRRVVATDTDAGLEELIGGEAHWLAGSTMVTFPCVHDGECLAVVTLFRDRRSPFGDNIAGMLATLSDLFAAQLARVIHVHHRHLPKDQWGTFGEPESDDFGDMDLAA